MGAHVEQGAVLALAGRAERVDQVGALDEAAVFALRTHAPVVHLTVHDGGVLVGYGQVRDEPGGAVGAVVVDPEHRRRGVGTALVHQARVVSGAALEVWAHGDLESAQGFARALGARAVRTLWLLGRDVPEAAGCDVAGARPGAAEPDAAPVRLRRFEVGVDEQAWLAFNARAFADHREQGRMTLDDLLVREREPWFDPQGFLLAVDAQGGVLGSVWTKEDNGDGSYVLPGQNRLSGPGSGEAHPSPDPPVAVATPGPTGDRSTSAAGLVGEIYVLGVDPAAQGMGLGRVLTEAGVQYLASRGVRRVVLFVDADNDAAVALYHAAGFVRAAVHVRYRLPGLPTRLDAAAGATMEA